MYLKYWNLKSKPFAQHFNLEQPFSSDSHSSCRLKLEYLIDDHKSLGLLLGDVGVGKTYLVKSLFHARRQGLKTILLLTAPQTRLDLYLNLARELGYPLHEFSLLSPDQQLQVIIQRLFEWTQAGQPVVILVDDAHLCTSREVMLGFHLLIRNCADSAMNIHFILSGHYALREFLSLVPELDDRVDVVAQLRSLSLIEVASYIEQRLEQAGLKQQIFTKEAMNYLYEVSAGSPRKINRLCDLSMLVACAEGCRIITPELISEVIEEVIHQRAA